MFIKARNTEPSPISIKDYGHYFLSPKTNLSDGFYGVDNNNHSGDIKIKLGHVIQN